MLCRKSERPLFKRVLLVGLGVVVIAAAATAAAKFDFKRFHADAGRLERLATATLPDTPSFSEDWPQWRGPNRDGVSTATGLLQEWPPEGPPLRWKRPIGRGFSSFAVAAGRVYTMDQEGPVANDASRPSFECIVCLEAETGREVWRFRYPNRYDERFGPGPRSTPAVDQDRVYAVGPTGIMHCLDTVSGEMRWRKDLPQTLRGRPMQYGVSFSPLVVGDKVFVMPGGLDGNSVAALDKYTGAVVWKDLDDPASYSSPIFTTAAGIPQVIFLTNTHLTSFDPDSGRQYWRRAWKAEGGFNVATPIAFGNYLFVASGYGKGCGLFEITASEGIPKVAPVYEHNRMRPYFSSPVKMGEFIFGFDQMDLVCMNVRTGSMAWREKTIREFRKASLLGADGQLIVFGESGSLTLLEATSSGYRERSTCKISPTRCWTPPAIASGKLFVRDDAQIFCFDLRP